MSDLALATTGEPRGEPQSPFSVNSMLIVLAVGIFSFAAMLLLGAYAPDLRSGKNGGAHALSNAATGFSGLVMLANATGRNSVIVRNDQMLNSEDLVVLTPDHSATKLEKTLEARGTKPTLIILPKWNVTSDEDHRGWVNAKGLIEPSDAQVALPAKWRASVERRRSEGALRTIAPAATGLDFYSPRQLQTISGKNITPLITDNQGRVVLAKLGNSPLYVLADPDLLSNQGVANVDQARSALSLLDYLNSTGSQSVLFDVTLNGLGHSPSPLRLAFDPPFLTTTLAILATLVLVSAQALNRFGPVRPRERALAFGKAALIDNAAALVRKAGREGAFGPRYACMLRERAIATFGVPPRLRNAAVDDYLDRAVSLRPFSKLVAETVDAHNPDALLAAARALHSWPQETGA